MSASSSMIAAVLVAVVSLATAANAQTIPGSFTDAKVRSQTCSKGCVAGLLVTAGIAAIFFSAIMCFAVWPSIELTSRQEKRAAAHKRMRERKEAEDEARAKNEALKDDE